MTKVEMRGPVVTMETLKTVRAEVWLRGPDAVPVHALAVAVREKLPAGGLSGIDIDVPTDEHGTPTGEVRLAWTVPMDADGSASSANNVRRVRELAQHLERNLLPTALAAFAVHHESITGRRPE